LETLGDDEVTALLELLVVAERLGTPDSRSGGLRIDNGGDGFLFVGYVDLEPAPSTIQ